MKQNQKRRVKREQPRKDNRMKRVNFDNERLSKFEKAEKEGKFVDPKDTAKSNDVRWYANNPELLRSAASLPFSYITGQPLPYSNNYAVPGVLALRWDPAVGSYSSNAVNQAKDAIYSYVVHANSRNQSYDATDLMMVILAGAHFFANLAFGIRAYGVMKMYDQRNKYLPKALIGAMGFDFDDLQMNLAQMWFDVNQLIAMSTQIWIPKNLPFVERWFWMNSNIYMDGDSVKSQYYMMTPAQMYQFSETADTNGTSIQYLNGWAPGTPQTWSQYMTAMNTQISALLNSSDRGLMFGDILKAYGKENIYAINEIDSSYTVVPVYDREVLTQIENSVSWNRSLMSITQEVNTNLIRPHYPATAANVASGNCILPNYQVLNFHQKEIPTPEQIMVATRLKPSGYQIMRTGAGVITEAQPRYMGTETIVNYVMATWNYGAAEKVNYETFSSIILQNSPDMGQLARWSAFDWSPWLYLYDQNQFPTNGTGTGQDVIGNNVPITAFGDWDNFTLVSNVELDQMHTTAIYSEFGVPIL
nr:capsid protein [Rat picobirnavirus]